MNPPTRATPPDFLTVPEACAIIGVSRQRLHQRMTQAERPIAAIDLTPPTRQRRDLRVPTAEVLAWRAEREAAGETVGPLPAWAIPIPPHPPEVPPVPPMPAITRGLGLPSFRPF